MTGLVKNQIVKQLARFTKNLSPNKISVKFLKGEGELHNLELDETTLSELLELPPWIRLTKAVCNRISAKIHWTKLKTDPICLYLDRVEVNMEAVDSDVNTPPTSSPQRNPSHAPHQPLKHVSAVHPSSSVLHILKSPLNLKCARSYKGESQVNVFHLLVEIGLLPFYERGFLKLHLVLSGCTIIYLREKPANRYGFVEKVVDGMFVQINSVIISFKFQAFLATFQMSRLFIQSTNPKWEADDLRNTRVKDETRGEVLTFKEITWSTLRIDANALYDEKLDQQSTPLRLITSHSALHITIKKRLEDCAVLSARLELLLDDILWVLTQSQLQAFSGLLHSVTQAMSQTARKGPETNPGQPVNPVTQQQQTSYASSQVNESKTDIESLNALFTKYDVRETAYHVRTGSIDLHLCDDTETAGGDGGAMHLQVNKLSVDYYPYHLAGTSRTDWPCHNEASLTRAYWVNQLLNAFRNSQSNKQMSPHRATQTHHRARSDSSVIGGNAREGPHHPGSTVSNPSSPRLSSKRNHPSSSAATSRQSAHSIRNSMQRPVFMLESCFVVRCEEFFIKPVTTCNVSKEEIPFLSSDKKALYLPTDMPAFQLDFTQYYYPGTVGSPVPCPNVFIQLNPIQLTLDIPTCLWLNSFARSILGQRTWSMGTPEQTNFPLNHIDIRIEGLMPKIVIPCPSDPCAAYKESRPQALQLQSSQVFITNSRTGYKSTQTDMLMFLQPFLASKVYSDFNSFPSLNSDVRPLPNSAWVNDCSLLVNNGKVDRLMNGVCHDIYDTHQPSQVWCISAEQVWLDFLGIEEANNRPMPFIDAVPIQIWIATPVPEAGYKNTTVKSPMGRSQSASPLNSPPHTRTNSEISPMRKAFEPSISVKDRADTVPSLASSNSISLHNSDSNVSHFPEAVNSISLSESLVLNRPPPAYEGRNGADKQTSSESEQPPPYEILAQNGPVLPVPHFEEAPPLPEKVPLSEELLNGLTVKEKESQQELDSVSKAELSLLIQIPQTVNIQLDHFQFVFLMRMQEMLVKLQEDLEKGQLMESMESQPMIFFSILARGVDLNIVLPPAPDREASRLNRDPSQNLSRNTSSLSSYPDTGIVSDSGCQSPDVIDSKSHSRTNSDGSPQWKDGLQPTMENHSPRDVSQSRPNSSQSTSHTSGRASVSSAPDTDGWFMVGAQDSKSSSGRVTSQTDSDASNASSHLDGSASKDSNKKSPKMVSILSIQGEEVEVGLHFHGYDKVIKIICPEVKLDELGVVSFDKFLNQKSFKKSLRQSALSSPSEATPMVRMRAEFGPSAERLEPTAGERGFMHVKANGVNGTLLVSTLGSLADCLEDEILVPPIPFMVEVTDSNVSINNDLPPALVSAPMAIPIDLNIENIAIRRVHTGVFHIRPMTAEPQERANEPAVMPVTRQESFKASQLSLSDSASVCSRAESLENEKQCLVAQMSVSRAALQSLQEERDALLKTIERLQQELSFSNREQDLLQEKMTSFQRGGRKGYR